MDVVERQNAEVAVGTTQLITSPEHTSQPTARINNATDHKPWTHEPTARLRYEPAQASVNPSSEWRRPSARPRQTWQRTISDDLSLGLHSAYSQAQDHPSWWKIVVWSYYVHIVSVPPDDDDNDLLSAVVIYYYFVRTVKIKLSANQISDIIHNAIKIWTNLLLAVVDKPLVQLLPPMYTGKHLQQHIASIVLITISVRIMGMLHSKCHMVPVTRNCQVAQCRPSTIVKHRDHDNATQLYYPLAEATDCNYWAMPQQTAKHIHYNGSTSSC